MSDYKYFYDFKLIDKEEKIEKKLSDFGGIIYNADKDSVSMNLLPDPIHITGKNDNRDGERYIRTVYGTRIIQIPVYFSENLGAGELFELNSWLGEKKQRAFQWVDDDENKEIDVIYKQGLDMDIQFGEEFNGLATLSFIAHNPYWRLRDEKPLIFKQIGNNPIIFKNRGNDKCFPLIKIVPYGIETILKWNDLDLKIKGEEEIYIDCEKERCYEYKNGILVLAQNRIQTDKYLSFPEIKKGKNLIQVKFGNISEIKIDMRTRII